MTLTLIASPPLLGPLLDTDRLDLRFPPLRQFAYPTDSRPIPVVEAPEARFLAFC